MGTPVQPGAATVRSLQRALLLLAAAAVGAAAAEGALVAGSSAGPTWVLLLLPLVAVLYTAAGIVAWWRRPSNGTGALLVVGGFAWAAAGLVNTTVPALVAVGEVLATTVLAVVVTLLLAFPSGRVAGRPQRTIVAAAFVVCVVLQAPLYLFAPAPDPYGVLAVADRPGLVTSGQWVQAVAGAVVVVATSVVLARRFAAAGPAQRRVLGPLYAYGVVAVLFIPVSAAAAGLLEERIAPVQLVVAQIVVMAGVPLAFLVGILRGGFGRTGELVELAAQLGGEQVGLERALAETLGDPTVRLSVWVPGQRSYVDELGAPVDPAGSAEGADRGEVAVELEGRRVGAIGYDAALIADPELVRAAGRVVALALERAHLTAELRASRQALRESRARIVAAGDEERRRIARDLHDGVQSRLVVLALAAQSMASDPAGHLDGLRSRAAGLRRDLDETTAELRRLVHGVMPPLLVERGLWVALEDLVDRMPFPTGLRLPRSRRALPHPVQLAAYFVVTEALTNAVKHAGADRAVVRLDVVGDALRIEVADDGVGGAGDRGGGLRGLADRLDVLGGSLALDSPPGGGTRLRAEVPCGS